MVKMRWSGERQALTARSLLLLLMKLVTVIAVAWSSQLHQASVSPYNLTTGRTCVYCLPLALFIALYCCWIKLRALIFYNFSFYSLSLCLGRFLKFSLFFPSSKHKLAKWKESLCFFLLSERTQKVRGWLLWMPRAPSLWAAPS